MFLEPIFFEILKMWKIYVFGVREVSPVLPGGPRRLPDNFWNFCFFSTCLTFFNFLNTVSATALCARWVIRIYWDCPQTTVLSTLNTVFFHCLLFIRRGVSVAGPGGHPKLPGITRNYSKLLNRLARLANSLENSSLFNRPFEPHFSDFDLILDPQKPPRTTPWSSFLRPQLR